MSLFASVEMAPGDPILGLTETYLADPRPEKINLGVGIYTDEHGNVPVMGAVQQVEAGLRDASRSRGYLPIDGLPAYNRLTQELIFGADSPLLEAGRVVTAQTIGGSGALRVAADLLHQVPGIKPRVAISNPSWGNHHVIFRTAGFELAGYRYFDDASRGLDFDGMKKDLGALKPGTVVLLHACCHNPTGVDPSVEQWAELVDLLRERELLPFVDMAYQGFDQGIEADATAIRLIAASGIGAFVVASSYSKSFSLYGERVGALSMVGADRDEATRLRSKIKQTIRANYSSPPLHGGTLVAGVLGNAGLRAQWEAELGHMRERIHAMRAGLVERLAAAGQPDFDFIQRQTGMFSYSGLSQAQVTRLREEFAIYALDSGRICMAALNQTNLDAVAEAIAAVVR